MTSKDLRTLMSTEVDTLAPMPDLVPQIIRQGATQVRRRRLAVSGLVAAAAIGGVAVAPWASGRSQGTDSRPADGGTSSAVPSPSPAVMRGYLDVTDPEVAAAFDAALPDRFTAVRVALRGPAPAELVTKADGTRVRIRVSLTAIDAPEVDDPKSEAFVRDYVRSGKGAVAAAEGRREPWSALVIAVAEPYTKRVPISQAELNRVVAHPRFLAMLASRTASDVVRSPAALSDAPNQTVPPSDAPEAEDAPAPPSDVPSTREPSPRTHEPSPTPREPVPTPREPSPTLTSEPSEPSDAPATAAPPSDR